MRPALLIAWREYRQYIFSRGFLLFLVLFPAGVLFVGGVMGFLEGTRPVRTFVVYDETGRYGAAIDEELERRRQRNVVSAWDAYAAIALREDAAGLLPAPFAPAPVTPARVAAFQAEGLGGARRPAAPYLRAGAGEFAEPRAPFLRFDLPDDVENARDANEAIERLRPYLLERKKLRGAGGPLFAAVIIPQGFSSDPDGPGAEFWSRNLTDSSLEGAVAAALDSVLRREAFAERGLPAGALEEIMSVSAPLRAFRPDRAPDEAELGARDRIETMLPAVMTYMLFVLILSVGNLLLTNTIEERSNKIVEVLLSSVTANQLMLGKLLGIAAVGLTLPAIFLVAGLVAAMTAGGEIWAQNMLGALFESQLFFVFLFYFLCAYLIFAMIFLAIGAMSNSLQDAQSFMGPVMLIVFLPLPFMLVAYQNPNGLIASVLTWIPIYTPYAVMLRAASSPPLWEILGATALMLAFAFMLARVMGRIFRQAILQSAPPKVRDVWRLVKGEPA